jgi:hypothetical protein
MFGKIFEFNEGVTANGTIASKAFGNYGSVIGRVRAGASCCAAAHVAAAAAAI